MKPTKAPVPEDLDRWENEGGSTPARRPRDEQKTDPNPDRRHIQQPAGQRTQGGLWGLCSRLMEGVGRMFGLRRHQAP